MAGNTGSRRWRDWPGLQGGSETSSTRGRGLTQPRPLLLMLRAHLTQRLAASGGAHELCGDALTAAPTAWCPHDTA